MATSPAYHGNNSDRDQPTLGTVAKLMSDARTLLQDKIPNYRYDEDSMLTALNVTLLDTRRLRPDLFVFDLNHAGQVPAFEAVDDTYIPIEPQFRLGILYWLCGHALARDQEDVQDMRATTFFGLGNAIMVGRARGGIGGIRTGAATAARTGLMATSEADRYWAKVVGQAAVALAGASDALLRVQLYDTLEEFFDGSNCWTESINFTVIPETQDYKLYPNGGRILRLDSVIDQNNVPQAALMPEIGTIHFSYPYTDTQPMLATVVKTVTDPLLCFPPNIPDWVLPAHGLKILHGLIGNMMLQPGQSYSNPALANFHLAKFNDGVSGAYVASSKANTVGAQAWAFPQQFAVRGQRGGVSTFNVHPSRLLR